MEGDSYKQPFWEMRDNSIQSYDIKETDDGLSIPRTIVDSNKSIVCEILSGVVGII